MRPTFSVLFNLETNEEIVIYEKLKKEGKNYTSSQTFYPQVRPLGSFLLDFLNTNMHKKENIETFITEYCFLYYYSIFNKNYKDKYVEDKDEWKTVVYHKKIETTQKLPRTGC